MKSGGPVYVLEGATAKRKDPLPRVPPAPRAAPACRVWSRSCILHHSHEPLIPCTPKAVCRVGASLRLYMEGQLWR